MASFDSLPADQRAVLELVLQRGRTYDEIAQMLSIDRAGVRQRALAAFDALGPQTRVDPARRALITDYLLGQLPARLSEQTRESLGRSPTERAWARVLASELGSLARDPLPEIPVQEASAGAFEPAAASGRPRPSEEPPADAPRRRRSSRRGGAVLLGLGSVLVAAIVVVVLIVALSGGGGAKSSTSKTASATTPRSTATSTTAGKVVAQVNLLPPSGGGAAKGIAQIITAESTTGVAIFATGVPANNHNAYAVWLYNSPTSSKLVGFVSPGVGSNGQLQTEGQLPTNASSYKQLLVTIETQAHPKSPGQIVLQGALTLS